MRQFGLFGVVAVVVVGFFLWISFWNWSPKEKHGTLTVEECVALEQAWSGMSGRCYVQIDASEISPEAQALKKDLRAIFADSGCHEVHFDDSGSSMGGVEWVYRVGDENLKVIEETGNAFSRAGIDHTSRRDETPGETHGKVGLHVYIGPRPWKE